MATLKELPSRRFVKIFIVLQRFYITLNARHRGLQLVCDVLCQLSFQAVLLSPRNLQILVNTNDALGNLTQFVVRKLGQVFGFEALVACRPACEDAQFGDVVAHKPPQHDGKEKHCRECKQQIVAVGLQCLGKVAVIWQGTAYDEFFLWQISGRIEIIVL